MEFMRKYKGTANSDWESTTTSINVASALIRLRTFIQERNYVSSHQGGVASVYIALTADSVAKGTHRLRPWSIG